MSETGCAIDWFRNTTFRRCSTFEEFEAVQGVWNWLFDRWLPTRRRTLSQRFAQAMGFETGLLIMTLPAVAWWMEIGLVEAFWLDAGFMLFFLVYAMVFNSLFDRIVERRLHGANG